MAKLQIKSEKLTPCGGIFSGHTAYCLKSHCGVRGYCRSQAGVSVQIICKFSNERMCTRKKDIERLSCGFEVLYAGSVKKQPCYISYLNRFRNFLRF